MRSNKQFLTRCAGAWAFYFERRPVMAQVPTTVAKIANVDVSAGGARIKYENTGTKAITAVVIRRSSGQCVSDCTIARWALKWRMACSGSGSEPTPNTIGLSAKKKSIQIATR